MSRYLDYGGSGQHTLNNRRYNSGEQIESNGFIDARRIGTYYNVDAYSNRNNNQYTTYVTTYPVVDIRDVGGWGWFRNYQPYNATS